MIGFNRLYLNHNLRIFDDSKINHKLEKVAELFTVMVHEFGHFIMRKMKESYSELTPKNVDMIYEA